MQGKIARLSAGLCIALLTVNISSVSALTLSWAIRNDTAVHIGSAVPLYWTVREIVKSPEECVHSISFHHEDADIRDYAVSAQEGATLTAAFSSVGSECIWRFSTHWVIPSADADSTACVISNSANRRACSSVIVHSSRMRLPPLFAVIPILVGTNTQVLTSSVHVDEGIVQCSNGNGWAENITLAGFSLTSSLSLPVSSRATCIVSLRFTTGHTAVATVDAATTDLEQVVFQFSTSMPAVSTSCVSYEGVLTPSVGVFGNGITTTSNSLADGYVGTFTLYEVISGVLICQWTASGNVSCTEHLSSSPNLCNTVPFRSYSDPPIYLPLHPQVTQNTIYHASTLWFGEVLPPCNCSCKSVAKSVGRATLRFSVEEISTISAEYSNRLYIILRHGEPDLLPNVALASGASVIVISPSGRPSQIHMRALTCGNTTGIDPLEQCRELNSTLVEINGGEPALVMSIETRSAGLSVVVNGLQILQSMHAQPFSPSICGMLTDSTATVELESSSQVPEVSLRPLLETESRKYWRLHLNDTSPYSAYNTLARGCHLLPFAQNMSQYTIVQAVDHDCLIKLSNGEILAFPAADTIETQNTEIAVRGMEGWVDVQANSTDVIVQQGAVLAVRLVRSNTSLRSISMQEWSAEVMCSTGIQTLVFRPAGYAMLSTLPLTLWGTCHVDLFISNLKLAEFSVNVMPSMTNETMSNMYFSDSTLTEVLWMDVISATSGNATLKLDLRDSSGACMQSEAFIPVLSLADQTGTLAAQVPPNRTNADSNGCIYHLFYMNLEFGAFRLSVSSGSVVMERFLVVDQGLFSLQDSLALSNENNTAILHPIAGYTAIQMLSLRDSNRRPFYNIHAPDVSAALYSVNPHGAVIPANVTWQPLSDLIAIHYSTSVAGEYTLIVCSGPAPACVTNVSLPDVITISPREWTGQCTFNSNPSSLSQPDTVTCYGGQYCLVGEAQLLDVFGNPTQFSSNGVNITATIPELFGNNTNLLWQQQNQQAPDACSHMDAATYCSVPAARVCWEADSLQLWLCGPRNHNVSTSFAIVDGNADYSCAIDVRTVQISDNMDTSTAFLSPLFWSNTSMEAIFYTTGLSVNVLTTPSAGISNCVSLGAAYRCTLDAACGTENVIIDNLVIGSISVADCQLAAMLHANGGDMDAATLLIADLQEDLTCDNDCVSLGPTRKARATSVNAADTLFYDATLRTHSELTSAQMLVSSMPWLGVDWMAYLPSSCYASNVNISCHEPHTNLCTVLWNTRCIGRFGNAASNTLLDDFALPAPSLMSLMQHNNSYSVSAAAIYAPLSVQPNYGVFIVDDEGCFASSVTLFIPCNVSFISDVSIMIMNAALSDTLLDTVVTVASDNCQNNGNPQQAIQLCAMDLLSEETAVWSVSVANLTSTTTWPIIRQTDVSLVSLASELVANADALQGELKTLTGVPLLVLRTTFFNPTCALLYYSKISVTATTDAPGNVTVVVFHNETAQSCTVEAVAAANLAGAWTANIFISNTTDSRLAATMQWTTSNVLSPTVDNALVAYPNEYDGTGKVVVTFQSNANVSQCCLQDNNQNLVNCQSTSSVSGGLQVEFTLSSIIACENCEVLCHGEMNDVRSVLFGQHVYNTLVNASSIDTSYRALKARGNFSNVNTMASVIGAVLVERKKSSDGVSWEYCVVSGSGQLTCTTEITSLASITPRLLVNATASRERQQCSEVGGPFAIYLSCSRTFFSTPSLPAAVYNSATQQTLTVWSFGWRSTQTSSSYVLYSQYRPGDPHLDVWSTITDVRSATPTSLLRRGGNTFRYMYEYFQDAAAWRNVAVVAQDQFQGNASSMSVTLHTASSSVVSGSFVVCKSWFIVTLSGFGAVSQYDALVVHGSGMHAPATVLSVSIQATPLEVSALTVLLRHTTHGIVATYTVPLSSVAANTDTGLDVTFGNLRSGFEVSEIGSSPYCITVWPRDDCLGRYPAGSNIGFVAAYLDNDEMDFISLTTTAEFCLPAALATSAGDHMLTIVSSSGSWSWSISSVNAFTLHSGVLNGCSADHAVDSTIALELLLYNDATDLIDDTLPQNAFALEFDRVTCPSEADPISDEDYAQQRPSSVEIVTNSNGNYTVQFRVLQATCTDTPLNVYVYGKLAATCTLASVSNYFSSTFSHLKASPISKNYVGQDVMEYPLSSITAGRVHTATVQLRDGRAGVITDLLLPSNASLTFLRTLNGSASSTISPVCDVWSSGLDISYRCTTSGWYRLNVTVDNIPLNTSYTIQVTPSSPNANNSWISGSQKIIQGTCQTYRLQLVDAYGNSWLSPVSNEYIARTNTSLLLQWVSLDSTDDITIRQQHPLDMSGFTAYSAWRQNITGVSLSSMAYAGNGSYNFAACALTDNTAAAGDYVLRVSWFEQGVFVADVGAASIEVEWLPGPPALHKSLITLSSNVIGSNNMNLMLQLRDQYENDYGDYESLISSFVFQTATTGWKIHFLHVTSGVRYTSSLSSVTDDVAEFPLSSLALPGAYSVAVAFGDYWLNNGSTALPSITLAMPSNTSSSVIIRKAKVQCECFENQTQLTYYATLLLTSPDVSSINASALTAVFEGSEYMAMTSFQPALSSYHITVTWQLNVTAISDSFSLHVYYDGLLVHDDVVTSSEYTKQAVCTHQTCRQPEVALLSSQTRLIGSVAPTNYNSAYLVVKPGERPTSISISSSDAEIQLFITSGVVASLPSARIVLDSGETTNILTCTVAPNTSFTIAYTCDMPDVTGLYTGHVQWAVAGNQWRNIAAWSGNLIAAPRINNTLYQLPTPPSTFAISKPTTVAYDSLYWWGVSHRYTAACGNNSQVSIIVGSDAWTTCSNSPASINTDGLQVSVVDSTPCSLETLSKQFIRTTPQYSVIYPGLNVSAAFELHDPLSTLSACSTAQLTVVIETSFGKVTGSGCFGDVCFQTAISNNDVVVKFFISSSTISSEHALNATVGLSNGVNEYLFTDAVYIRVVSESQQPEISVFPICEGCSGSWKTGVLYAINATAARHASVYIHSRRHVVAALATLPVVQNGGSTDACIAHTKIIGAFDLILSLHSGESAPCSTILSIAGTDYTFEFAPWTMLDVETHTSNVQVILPSACNFDPSDVDVTAMSHMIGVLTLPVQSTCGDSNALVLNAPIYANFSGAVIAVRWHGIIVAVLQLPEAQPQQFQLPQITLQMDTFNAAKTQLVVQDNNSNVTGIAIFSTNVVIAVVPIRNLPAYIDTAWDNAFTVFVQLNGLWKAAEYACVDCGMSHAAAGMNSYENYLISWNSSHVYVQTNEPWNVLPIVKHCKQDFPVVRVNPATFVFLTFGLQSGIRTQLEVAVQSSGFNGFNATCSTHGYQIKSLPAVAKPNISDLSVFITGSTYPSITTAIPDDTQLPSASLDWCVTAAVGYNATSHTALQCLLSGNDRVDCPSSVSSVIVSIQHCLPDNSTIFFVDMASVIAAKKRIPWLIDDKTTLVGMNVSNSADNTYQLSWEYVIIRPMQERSVYIGSISISFTLSTSEHSAETPGTSVVVYSEARNTCPALATQTCNAYACGTSTSACNMRSIRESSSTSALATLSSHDNSTCKPWLLSETSASATFTSPHLASNRISSCGQHLITYSGLGIRMPSYASCPNGWVMCAFSKACIHPLLADLYCGRSENDVTVGMDTAAVVTLPVLCPANAPVLCADSSCKPSLSECIEADYPALRVAALQQVLSGGKTPIVVTSSRCSPGFTFAFGMCVSDISSVAELSHLLRNCHNQHKFLCPGGYVCADALAACPSIPSCSVTAPIWCPPRQVCVETFQDCVYSGAPFIQFISGNVVGNPASIISTNGGDVIQLSGQFTVQTVGRTRCPASRPFLCDNGACVGAPYSATLSDNEVAMLARLCADKGPGSLEEVVSASMCNAARPVQCSVNGTVTCVEAVYNRLPLSGMELCDPAGPDVIEPVTTPYNATHVRCSDISATGILWPPSQGLHVPTADADVCNALWRIDERSRRPPATLRVNIPLLSLRIPITWLTGADVLISLTTSTPGTCTVGILKLFDTPLSGLQLSGCTTAVTANISFVWPVVVFTANSARVLQAAASTPSFMQLTAYSATRIIAQADAVVVGGDAKSLSVLSLGMQLPITPGEIIRFDVVRPGTVVLPQPGAAKKSLSDLEIALIVIGSVFGLMILICIAVLWKRKRDNKPGPKLLRRVNGAQAADGAAVDVDWMSNPMVPAGQMNQRRRLAANNYYMSEAAQAVVHTWRDANGLLHAEQKTVPSQQVAKSTRFTMSPAKVKRLSLRPGWFGETTKFTPQKVRGNTNAQEEQPQATFTKRVNDFARRISLLAQYIRRPSSAAPTLQLPTSRVQSPRLQSPHAPASQMQSPRLHPVSQGSSQRILSAATTPTPAYTPATRLFLTMLQPSSPAAAPRQAALPARGVDRSRRPGIADPRGGGAIRSSAASPVIITRSNPTHVRGRMAATRASAAPARRSPVALSQPGSVLMSPRSATTVSTPALSALTPAARTLAAMLQHSNNSRQTPAYLRPQEQGQLQLPRGLVSKGSFFESKKTVDDAV